MQTQTTARPASMGKTSAQPFGFPLRLFAFKKSIRKALEVKPRVEWVDLHGSNVRSSDGSTDFFVKFYLCNGELYAACSCYAAWKAQPCYHVAAAAIDRDLINHDIEQPARVTEPEPVDLDTPDEIEEQPLNDNRFLPRVRESFSYDMAQVTAQARQLATAYPGWDLSVLAFLFIGLLCFFGSTPALADDNQIKTCIVERLAAAPSLADEKQIVVTVENSNAKLTGKISDTRKKATATRIAKSKACGASSVTNELEAARVVPIRKKDQNALLPDPSSAKPDIDHDRNRSNQ